MIVRIRETGGLGFDAIPRLLLTGKHWAELAKNPVTRYVALSQNADQGKERSQAQTLHDPNYQVYRQAAFVFSTFVLASIRFDTANRWDIDGMRYGDDTWFERHSSCHSPRVGTMRCYRVKDGARVVWVASERVLL